MSIYLRRKNTVNYYLDLDINCITYSTLIRDVIMYTIIIYTITVQLYNTFLFPALSAEVVLPVSARQTVHANGTLTVRAISRDADSGTYTCVATAGDIVARADLDVNIRGTWLRCIE